MSLAVINNAVTQVTIQPTQVSETENATVGIGTNRPSNPATEPLRQLRGPGQVPRKSFASRLRAGITRVGVGAATFLLGPVKSLVGALMPRPLQGLFLKFYQKPYDRIRNVDTLNGMTLNLMDPKSGEKFKWEATRFKDAVLSLPWNKRVDAIAHLQATIQERIANGCEVYHKVRLGQGDLPPANAKNVADFTLYLYARAAANKEDFVNGSFSVKDENGYLHKWLDTSDQIYARTSTHMTALHKFRIMNSDGTDHENVQRGIDLLPSLEEGLPANFKTIVYGAIPAWRGMIGTRRLLLKAESFGTRFTTLLGARSHHENTGIHSRKANFFTDLGRSTCHLFSFFATRGQQGNLSCRKEHPSDKIADLMNKWVKKMKKVSGSGDKEIRTCVMMDTVLDCEFKKSGYGLRVLNQKMNDVRKLLENSEKETGYDYQIVRELLADLEKAIEELPHHDRPDVRVGNEVLID